MPRSEDGAMALALLPLLLPPLLLLPAVGFTELIAGCCAAAVAGGASSPAPGARSGHAPLLSHTW